jgi:predicted RNA-binding Zn-ribbon protein involved in translation (DUF1610 family)
LKGGKRFADWLKCTHDRGLAGVARCSVELQFEETLVMVKCPMDTALQQGTWYLWRTGKKYVFLACPSCGGVVMINMDDINEDGTIVSGFQCRKRGCGFDDQITLLEWTGRP